MVYYSYDEPGEFNSNIKHTLSTEDIIKSYRPFYDRCLKQMGKDPKNFTDEVCISDWIACNWAYRTDSRGDRINKA